VKQSPPPDIVALGRRLLEARQRARMTVRDVAGLMRIDPRVLARCEHGAQAPAPHQAEALARIYGVAVPWIMQGDESAPAATPTPVTPLFPAAASAGDVAEA